MELVKAINSNHVLRCCCCGKPIKGWYFTCLERPLYPIEFSLCRSCNDIHSYDTIKAIMKRKVWWYKGQDKPLKTLLLTGGLAATFEHLLAGEDRNETTR